MEFNQDFRLWVFVDSMVRRSEESNGLGYTLGRWAHLEKFGEMGRFCQNRAALGLFLTIFAHLPLIDVNVTRKKTHPRIFLQTILHQIPVLNPRFD